MNTFNGAQILVHRLQVHGIRTLFGIPGGNILPFYDALHESGLRHVLAKHEQGAAFMAQGYARTTGKPGVCVATSGPGATNLVTALADALFDSVPLVALTGQVPQSLKGTEAFQEVDMVRLTQGITKRSFYVDDVKQLAATVDYAFHLATLGRPGPVLIDLPKDVQLATCPYTGFLPMEEAMIECDLGSFEIREFCRMVHQATRPVIIAGHGVALSGAEEELVQLAETRGIPVATTLHGVGCMGPSHPLYLGMAGMHGSARANGTLHGADLVIALGIRFDDRLTGNLSRFCPSAQFIHVDIDALQLNRLKRVDLAIRGDLKMVLQSINPCLQPKEGESFGAEAHDGANGEGSLAARFLRALAHELPNDVLVATDVGQHQMWVAQHFPFRRPGCLLTSGGQGTMGFGLPAAIGAAMAQPHRRVLCVTGDGSLMMNLQELATLAELGVHVTVVVLNNGGLGMVRQQQEFFYQNHLSASQSPHRVRFDAVAEAFGIRSARLKMDDLTLLPEVLKGQGPVLLDVETEADQMVWPMVAPGYSVDRMMGIAETMAEIND